MIWRETLLGEIEIPFTHRHTYEVMDLRFHIGESPDTGLPIILEELRRGGVRVVETTWEELFGIFLKKYAMDNLIPVRETRKDGRQLADGDGDETD